MPFTLYHFGPSAFLGLALRKWLDFPVFVLANVIVDIEVLFFNRWPVHRYFHTFLIGAIVGACWGLLAHRLRGLFKWLMQIIRIPYQTSFRKMVVSGVLGVWLHVFADAIYHSDVNIFWPSKARPLYGLISQEQVETVCVAFLIAAIFPYTIAVVSYAKQKKAEKSLKEAN